MKRNLSLFIVLTMVLTSVIGFTSPAVLAEYNSDNVVYEYEFDGCSATPEGADRCLQTWADKIDLIYFLTSSHYEFGDTSRARVLVDGSGNPGTITFDFRKSANNTEEYKQYYIQNPTDAVLTVIAYPGNQAITAKVWNDSISPTQIPDSDIELVKTVSYSGADAWYKYIYKINISNTCSNARYLKISPSAGYAGNLLDFANIKIYKNFSVSMLTTSGNYALSAGAETSYVNNNGGTSLANQILLQAQVSDSTNCTGVDFYANNEKVGEGTGVGGGKYELRWRTAKNGTPINAGVYAVKAVAKTSNGSGVSSDAITMTIEEKYPRETAKATANCMNRGEGGFVAGDVDGTYLKLETKGQQTVEYDNTEKAFRIHDDNHSAGNIAGTDADIYFKNNSYLDGYRPYEISTRIKFTDKGTSGNPEFFLNVYYTGGYVRAITFKDGEIGYWSEWARTTWNKLADLEYGKVYDIKVVLNGTYELIYIDGKRVTSDWVQLADNNGTKSNSNRVIDYIKLTNLANSELYRNIYVYAFSCSTLTTTTQPLMPTTLTVDGSRDLSKVPASAESIHVVYPAESHAVDHLTNTNLIIKNGGEQLASINAAGSNRDYTYSLGDVDLTAGETYQLYATFDYRGERLIGEVTVADDMFEVTETCGTNIASNAVVSGSKLQGIVKYSNNSAQDNTAVVIFAIYDGDLLERVDFDRFTVFADEKTGQYETDILLPTDFDKTGKTFGLFCFEDLVSIKPLFRALFTTAAE